MIDKLISDLNNASDPKKIPIYERFFKTGAGQYGEGDIFIGLTVPQQRTLAKKYHSLKLVEIGHLLKSPIHEYRLTALLILVDQFSHADETSRQKIVDFYLKSTKYINNWDLVDLSADKILGEFLSLNPRGVNTKENVLQKLATSNNIWERRIAIVATFAFIKKGQFDITIQIAEKLLSDKHDLIHKAVGWMLREVGKRDEKTLTDFLDKHYRAMPRTTLRYSIERLDQKKRTYYLKK